MRARILALAVACGVCGGDDAADDGAASSGATTASTAASEDASAGASESTGVDAEPYGRCTLASSCFLANAGIACIAPGDGSEGFCAAGCADASECPDAPSGHSPTCEDLSGQGSVCYLECGSGSCPDGMTCRQLATTAGTRSICFWSPA